MTSRDERVLKLQKQVDAKRKKLSTATRFKPVTNCSLVVNGSRKNINVIGMDDALISLINLNALRMSAEALGVAHPKMEGYTLEEWISDLKGRIAELDVQAQRKQLQTLERRLNAQLSDDKKADMELDDIESLLK